MKKIVFLLVLCLNITLFAQKPQVIATDTAFFGLIGSQKSTIVNNKKQGKYVFESKVKKSFDIDTLTFSILNIDGDFNSNLMNGLWKINFKQFYLDDFYIRGDKVLNVSHNVNGVDKILLLRFTSGKLNGTSELINRKIVNKNVISPKTALLLNFKQDTLVGSFAINSDGVVVKGQTNSAGFFDKNIEFIYQKDGLEIKEKRLYDNGFLLELEKINLKTNEIITKIFYQDISNKLNAIKNKLQTENISISNKYFGVEFNSSYHSNDPKLLEQADANKLFEKHLMIIDSLNPINRGDHKIVLKLTRRFYLNYDEDDNNDKQILVSEVKNFKEVLEAFINKPSFILRKKSSDTLNNQHILLSHIKTKVDIIDDVVSKINGGFFEFINRNSFYKNGINGLNQVDTIIFTNNNKQEKRSFIIEPLIVSPKDIQKNLSLYIKSLTEKADYTISNVKKSLTIYENQDIIDSLDLKIASNQEATKQIFLQSEYYLNLEKDKIPFSYKLYQSIKERLIAPLESKYLKNSLSHEETIQLGNEINCYYDFLINNKEKLTQVGEMRERWDKKLFTVYRENPFDFRDLETKILGGVQNASNILLSSYGNQMLNAKNCDQFETDLNKIFLLNERVEYLVKNINSQNVQLLNRTLRRERVANRIERILEL